jgi:NADPH:quinone reductase-like Zn-dependent oxidoreductase
MLAACFDRYGPPEVLEWREVPDPELGPGDVLIDVRACGVNHSDLDSRAGTSRWTFPMPMVLGCEFAGVVAAVGEDVRNVAIGDRVTAYQQYACGRCERCMSWRQDLCREFTVLGTDTWGGYAEYARVPERAVLPLRPQDDLVLAAAAQCVVSTAWHMTVTLGAIRAGELVFVPSASGGVASALVQCAKHAGARVIASVGEPSKAGAIERLGADEVFSYRDSEVSERLSELTGGDGVDAVLDTVGGELFEAHLGALRRDGRLVTCGAHAGEHVSLDIVRLFQHGWRILGFRVATPHEIRTSLRLALDGLIDIPVAATFPMERAADAHEQLAQRRHVGKLVLVREGHD